MSFKESVLVPANDYKKTKETVVRSDGRESDVTIEYKDKIGKGAYGDIYQSEIELDKDQEKVRKLKQFFAVKDFKKAKAGSSEQALTIYQSLKEAHVDTWSTYRRVKGSERVLMTDGTSGDALVLSSSDSSRSKNSILNVLDRGIDKIENIEEVVKRAIENALRAGENGILLPSDAWLIRMHALVQDKPNIIERLLKRDPKKRVSAEQVFVGDFDEIVVDKSKHHKYANLIYLYQFLDTLIRQITNESSIGKHVKEVQEQIAQAMKIIQRVDDWNSYIVNAKYRARRGPDEHHPFIGPQVFEE